MNRLCNRLGAVCFGLLVVFGLSIQTGWAQKNLVVDVQSSWVGASNGGYIPVKVTVRRSSGKPLARNVKLNVCAQTGGWMDQKVVNAWLSIKAGDKSGSVEILCPYESVDDRFLFWIERDGNCVHDRRDFWLGSSTLSGWGGAGVESPSYLFASSKAKPKPNPGGSIKMTNGRNRFANVAIQRENTTIPADLPTFELLYSLNISSNAGHLQRPGMVRQPSLALNTPFFQVVPLNKLPEKWIGLSAVDHLFLTLSDFKKLAAESPAKREAIRNWVIAGGRLIVSDCGDGCVNANSILKNLDQQLVAKPKWQWLTEQAMDDLKKRRFWNVGSRNGIQSVNVQFNDFYGDAQGILDPIRANRPWKFSDSLPVLENNESGSTQSVPAICCPYGEGQLVAISGLMDKWKVNDWVRLVALMEVAGDRLNSKVGGSVVSGMMVENVEIPGVREPPKSAFQILIVCFVLLAGPVNYLFLRRIGRLNILLITVPIISFFVCLCLFGYAFITQGFGTKHRDDSYTFVDQTKGVAVSRSYKYAFSGLHPGTYPFEDELLVYPASVGTARPLRYTMLEDRIAYSGGSIQARTPHQINLTKPFETEWGLQFREKEGVVEVNNEFPNEIRFLMFRYGSEIYSVDNLPAGQIGVATVCDEQAVERMKQILAESNVGDQGFRSVVRWGVGFERLATFDRETLDESNRYVALLDEFDGSPSLRPGLEPSGGIHVIYGKW